MEQEGEDDYQSESEINRHKKAWKLQDRDTVSDSDLPPHGTSKEEVPRHRPRFPWTANAKEAPAVKMEKPDEHHLHRGGKDTSKESEGEKEEKEEKEETTQKKAKPHRPLFLFTRRPKPPNPAHHSDINNSINLDDGSHEDFSALEHFHRYFIHNSLISGVLADTPQVEHFFGEARQNWNPDHPAACQVFATGPGGKLARSAIRTVHGKIYHASVRKEAGRVTSGDELLKLFDYGQKNGATLLFTYVLTDHDFRFSRTGAEYFKDMLSKHAVHSDCARNKQKHAGKKNTKTSHVNPGRSVRYAGEFHVRRNPSGQYVLFIDNNSGTYGPDRLLLPNLKTFLQSEFPGLLVEAVDFHSPDCQLARNLCNSGQFVPWELDLKEEEKESKRKYFEPMDES